MSNPGNAKDLCVNEAAGSNQEVFSHSGQLQESNNIQLSQCFSTFLVIFVIFSSDNIRLGFVVIMQPTYDIANNMKHKMLSDTLKLASCKVRYFFPF